MYTKEELKASLFFDIETVANEEIFTGHMEEIWIEKHHIKNYEKEIEYRNKKLILEKNNSINGLDSQDYYNLKTKDTPSVNDIFLKYAPLSPEFGKILCISIGIFDDNLEPEVECLLGTEEKIIKDFFGIVVNNPKLKLSGYNIKGFDIPFIVRRSLIKSLSLPTQLRLKGKKPWEISFNDLAEDYKGLMWEMIPLDLLTTTFGIPTPKDEFGNHEVSTLYSRGIITQEQVGNYCNKDVKANMLVCKKLLY